MTSVHIHLSHYGFGPDDTTSYFTNYMTDEIGVNVSISIRREGLEHTSLTLHFGSEETARKFFNDGLDSIALLPQE